MDMVLEVNKCALKYLEFVNRNLKTMSDEEAVMHVRNHISRDEPSSRSVTEIVEEVEVISQVRITNFVAFDVKLMRYRV